MKILIAFIFLSVFSLQIIAQDTLKIMHYNLLNYNNYTSYCTTSNNDVSNKDAYITSIIDYVLPDIFSVNEIEESSATLDRLLNNVMNTNGRTYYARANRTNYGSSSIINALYYDTRKLVLHSQDVVVTSVRDINLYKLYYSSASLASGADTAWLTCIVMHLKAGSYTSDEDERAAEISLLMNYLNSLNNAANYLVLGDLNVYSDDEACFQNLINHPNANIRFYDPIDKMGDWNNNSYYEDYHTQSTHSASNNCAASGGMDDRFDFILSSLDIIIGSKKVQYIPNSYYALAQDGNHFNSSLVDAPTNTLVPSNVLNALYNNSDHLPVIMKLSIDEAVSVDEFYKPPFSFFCSVSDNQSIKGSLMAHISGNFTFRVFSSDARLISISKTYCEAGINDLEINNIKPTGQLILIQVASPDAHSLTKKLIY